MGNYDTLPQIITQSVPVVATDWVHSASSYRPESVFTKSSIIVLHQIWVHQNKIDQLLEIASHFS